MTTPLGSLRLVQTPEGGHPELWLLIDGVAQWRSAHWVEEETYRLCHSRGQDIRRGPVLRPRLFAGEILQCTEIACVAIVTYDRAAKDDALTQGRYLDDPLREGPDL